jgi:hypothetical protein
MAAVVPYKASNTALRIVFMEFPDKKVFVIVGWHMGIDQWIADACQTRCSETIFREIGQSLNDYSPSGSDSGHWNNGPENADHAVLIVPQQESGSPAISGWRAAPILGLT